MTLVLRIEARGYRVTLDPDWTLTVSGPEPADRPKTEEWVRLRAPELRGELADLAQGLVGAARSVFGTQAREIRQAPGQMPRWRVEFHWTERQC